MANAGIREPRDGETALAHLFWFSPDANQGRVQ
jgi:hypothetical protein